jgi:predicted adenylyl cyclase CyaB
MNNNLEIELRGPISKEKIRELTILFKKKGKFKSRKDRILIHFFEDHGDEAALRNLTKDFRIRTTNGRPELILKLGAWGGREQRQELCVTLHNGQFDTLVTILGHMGFDKGIFAERRGSIYTYKGIEFSLVEVPGHSYYFEAEKMVSKKSEVAKAHQDILAVCAELGLTVFDDTSFHEYIALLNRESNPVYDFKKYKFGYFKKKYGV